MLRVVAISGMALVAACELATTGEPVLVDPGEVALARTYVLAGCATDYAPFQAPPDCLTGAGGSGGSSYADSGRVVLRADRSASWMFGEHRVLSIGCSPCGPQPGTVSMAEGTYTFNGGDLVLALPFGTVLLATGGPSRVRRTWPGPDSLVFRTGVQSSQNGRAIFRPTP